MYWIFLMHHWLFFLYNFLGVEFVSLKIDGNISKLPFWEISLHTHPQSPCFLFWWLKIVSVSILFTVYKEPNNCYSLIITCNLEAFFNRQRAEKTFHKRRYRNGNKHMKRCSVSSLITGVKIKTIMKCI